MRIKKILTVGVVLSLAIVLLSACQQSPPVESPPKVKNSPQFETQISDEDSITVSVTPLSIFEKGNNWTFEIALDTHAGELSTDLMQDAILIDENGQNFNPIFWEGDEPGGHHLSGILSFSALDTESATLKIMNIPEGKIRIFTFNK